MSAAFCRVVFCCHDKTPGAKCDRHMDTETINLAIVADNDGSAADVLPVVDNIHAWLGGLATT